MKAATLMNSGTVTKKPVMKLRRSQDITAGHKQGSRHKAQGTRPETCDLSVETCSSLPVRAEPPARGEDDDPENDPVPGEGSESGSTDEIDERLDDDERGEERHHEPDRDFARPLQPEMMPHFEQLVGKRRRHRRHREKERELRRGRTIEAHRQAADDGCPGPRDA